MSRRAAFTLTLFAGLAGCAAPMKAPSLSPRAAEKIDPRLPIADNSAALPADAALIAGLRAARDKALAAAAGVEPSIRAAEAAVAASGPPESESWVAAQQAVSVAIAARAPFTAALGDFDRLLAARVSNGGRFVPAEVVQGRAMAAELAAVDQRQGAAIAALEQRLR